MVRRFLLGDILSITTGALVTSRLMDGVYDILDFMTGQELTTLALPGAANMCKPVLLEQFPELVGVEAPDFADEMAVWEWLDEQESRFGREHLVKPLSPDQHVYHVSDAEAALLQGSDGEPL